MKKGLKLGIISVIIIFLVAFIGSLFTDTGTWYESSKPAITPPNIVFPIVWNILFVLIAISLYFVLKKGIEKIIILFFINLFLNIFWSIFFFYMKNPLVGFIDIIFLWFSTLLLVYYNFKYKNKISAYLLLPYLIWITFASILNFLFLI